MTLPRKDPAVGKKKHTFPFQVAVVCWMDLLGYGGMFAEAEFNPLHPKAVEAIKRLHRFHEIVGNHSARNFPTLVMNDGAAAYRDLSLRSRSATHDFLVRAWKLYKQISEEEALQGHPGIRMVIAAGFRIRRRRTDLDSTKGHLKSILRRYRDSEISPEQAIREAANSRHLSDIVPELQANFAFTKAYVAESSGSKGGLKGARFFLELALLNTPAPAWLVMGEPIKWSDERLRLATQFAPVSDIVPYKHEVGGPVGIRDGLQIAQTLTGDSDVLNALRAAQKASTDLADT